MQPIILLFLSDCSFTDDPATQELVPDGEFRGEVAEQEGRAVLPVGKKLSKRVGFSPRDKPTPKEKGVVRGPYQQESRL